jgi:hypothetical protein
MAGSMRERAPGVWELRVFLGRDPVSGRKEWTSRTFHGSRRGAERALARLVAELDDPMRAHRVAPAKVTLAELITAHLREHQ